MTFDSLSATHPTVGKILNKWLVYEANDKKKEETSLEETDWEQHFPAAYKAVRVPGQDNFADCGVYLMHYAIQLMRDDGELRQYIFDQAPLKTKEDKAKNRRMWDGLEMALQRRKWKSVIDDLPPAKGGSKEKQVSRAKRKAAPATSNTQGPSKRTRSSQVSKDGESWRPLLLVMHSHRPFST